MLILNIDYSGSVQVYAKDINFQYFGEDETKTQLINGVEWNDLNENERSEYVLESLAKALSVSVDGQHESIDITVEEEDEFLEEYVHFPE